MDAHEPDRIALVFGLVFTIVGAVTLVGLAGTADIDGGAALGASMVLAALLVAVVSVTSLRDRRSAADGGQHADEAANDKGATPLSSSLEASDAAGPGGIGSEGPQGASTTDVGTVLTADRIEGEDGGEEE